MIKAVFFDRDDTLMEANGLPAPPAPAAPGDVIDPRLVRLKPGAVECCSRLKKAGYVLIVVSNQGVVARGGGTVEQVRSVNKALGQALGDVVDGFYFCPFHPKGLVPEFAHEHPWRKPGSGMIRAAAAEFGIDLAASWLIGDASRDVEAGVAAGLERGRCVQIGEDVPDLARAADRVLGVASGDA